MDCVVGDSHYIVASTIGILAIVASLAIDYGIYKSIENYYTANMKPGKTLFIIGLLFTTMSTITLMVFSILILCTILYCHFQTVLFVEFSNWLFSLCYGFQILFLHILWLTRLKIVFRGTLYQLSWLFFWSYLLCLLTIYIGTVLLMIFYPLFLETRLEIIHSRWFIYGALYALSGAFLTMLLVVFVYKLNRLYKVTLNNGSSIANDDLVSIITKNTILATISICCTFVLSMVMILSGINQSIHTPLEVAYSLFLMDIVSNVACVLLTYNYSDNLYVKLCGCSHLKCATLYQFAIEKSRPLPGRDALTTASTMQLKEQIEIVIEEVSKQPENDDNENPDNDGDGYARELENRLNVVTMNIREREIEHSYVSIMSQLYVAGVSKQDRAKHRTGGQDLTPTLTMTMSGTADRGQRAGHKVQISASALAKAHNLALPTGGGHGVSPSVTLVGRHGPSPSMTKDPRIEHTNNVTELNLMDIDSEMMADFVPLEMQFTSSNRMPPKMTAMTPQQSMTTRLDLDSQAVSTKL